MSGVSADIGQRPGDDLFRMAYEGGQSFMSRLQELAQKKDEYDAALAELRLGKAAKAAYDDAVARRSEAAADLQAAADLHEQAKQDAAAVLAKAKTDAAALRASADSYAATTKAEANETLTRAAEREAAAAATHEAAQAALGAHQATQARADQAKADADALAATLKAKIVDLQGVLARVQA